MTTTNASEVIEAEKEHIRGRTGSNEPYSGLAFSGGGIRSASFALGVMQGLFSGTKSHPDILAKFDYLSTVSGGGYIGSALTWFRHQQFKKGFPAATGADFPFGRKKTNPLTGSNGPNKALDFIRQHGNYLTPSKELDLVSLFSVLFRSIFISLFVYLSLLTTFMFCWQLVDNFTPGTTTTLTALLGKYSVNVPLYLALLIALTLALSSLAFSFATVFQWGANSGYRLLIAMQSWMGLLGKLTIALLVFGSLPYLAIGIKTLWIKISMAGFSTLAGILIGFFQTRREQGTSKASKPKIPPAVQMVIGASLLIYGLLLSAYIIADGLHNNFALATSLAAVALVVGIMVNLNHAGLHRMYRDRLMETFQPNPVNVQKNKWGPATEANTTLLETLCPRGQGLYHLINCNVVLVDSGHATYHGRGGDSFLLSPLFCGSQATGWQQTNKYMKNFFCRGITLPTAMAISGAAANPNAGVAGDGVTRNQIVSTLMSLLNLRLGYWARNPQKGNGCMPPNYLQPGLIAGVFGGRLNEEYSFLELSDGGHFENLALYELIRRQVSFIVISDAGADPDYSFADLANAVERVRVDFGVKIRFRPEEEYNLEGLLPDSAKDGLMTHKYHLARRGYAIADIEYEKNRTGLLVYLKPTLTKGLPEDIYGYKTAFPTFPDQTTADQFFDEAQFEAYRELGYQLTKQMFAEEKIAAEFDKFFT